MQEMSKTSQMKRRRRSWAVLMLAVAALLVFAGAALAQETQPQTGAAATAVAPKPDPGLVVVHVVADSPAAAAGVARGDIILAVDNDAVNTLAELTYVIRSHNPGDVIVLQVMHGDEERSLSVTLGDRNGRPELGLISIGSDMTGRRLGQRRSHGFDKPGRGDRQGHGPATPFGRGQRPGEHFGQGRGPLWSDAQGAVVVDVATDGAAAAAGLQAGDVITGLNDASVASGDDLIALLGDHKPGDVVTVAYQRDGASASTEVTLGAHPDDATRAYLGVRIAPAGPARFGAGQGISPFMPGQGILSGALVVDVTADGPAATAGLAAGDRISAVNGKAIADPQALVDAVKAAQPGDEMVLTVQSPGPANEAVDITVTLGENDKGEALLGVQIGPAIHMQGPGGMDFDFHNFQGQGQNGMPFFFGRPGQQDGGRFQFHRPPFRFHAPDKQRPPAAPDASSPQQPGYGREGA